MIRNASIKARLFGKRAFTRPIKPTCTLIFRDSSLAYRQQPWPLSSFQNTPFAVHRCISHSSTGQVGLVDDTIYALSTASGKAGIAIVRISGPAWFEIYQALCPAKPLLKARLATLRTLRDPENPETLLDSDAIALYFPTPKTVTGEDVLEFHIHGGPATVKAVLSAIPRCQSKTPIRYAEPGEFTRRAFQNNRLDLAQVEALGDTLSAETEQQRRAAVRGHSGKLGRTYEEWRRQLLYARGELEALIDFSEDQHFDESPAELLISVHGQVQSMMRSIAQHTAASQRGELLKKGIRISLLGPPNAGKSSLLNQIAGREASIVSQEAGTTRDIVEVSLDIRGFLCTFADTAGLRTASSSKLPTESSIGAIEEEGIRRAKAKANESDVIISMASVESASSDFSIQYDTEAVLIAQSEGKHALLVVNKCDIVPSETLGQMIEQFRKHLSTIFTDQIPEIVTISCRDAESSNVEDDPGNINEFTTKLVDIFQNMTDVPVEYEDLLGVTERQRQLLATCSTHLHLFKNEAEKSEIDDEADIVLAAEHLRSAANCLSRITGRGEAGDVEEVLGVVFEKFCVGK